jgi:uncharacterized protein with PIN domain
MNRITIRFFAELNDLLPPAKRQRPFTHFFKGQPAVKDLIESLGVPHTEVDLILVNGESVGFEYCLQGGETVGVYPIFQAIDISALTKVRPEPLSEFRFALDTHLGKLALYLRMVGFDSYYSNAATDDKLAAISAEKKRVLLTRDRGLLKRSKVLYGYWIRSTSPSAQLREVLQRFDLYSLLRPFQRCLRCNEVLQTIAKEEVFSRLPVKVREYCDVFHLCPGCGRLYWNGTHHEHMKEFIRQIQKENQNQTRL